MPSSDQLVSAERLIGDKVMHIVGPAMSQIEQIDSGHSRQWLKVRSKDG
jgi:hypothetical protein